MQAAATLCNRAATMATDPDGREVVRQAPFRHVFVRSCAAPFGSVNPSSEQGHLHHLPGSGPAHRPRLSRPRPLLVSILAPTSEVAHAVDRVLRICLDSLIVYSGSRNTG